MRLRRFMWLGAGAAAGAYLVDRWHRNSARDPRPLVDYNGRALEPTLVKLEGGEYVPVVVAGQGPAVVLVPGLTGESQVFRYQVPALSAEHRVIAPNLRLGFNGVERRFDQFVHDVATVLDALDEPSACLLGLSFGGPVAMRFATLYPDRVWALVLANTLARLDLSHVGLNRTLLIPVARWTSRVTPVPVMRRLAELWGRWGVWVYDPSPGNERIVRYELEVPSKVPGALGTARIETFRDIDLRSELRRIYKPALVVAGGSDGYTPIEWQREIAALLPDSDYVEIPEGGHLSLISRAEIFNEVVCDWLAGMRKRTTTVEPRDGSAPEAGSP